MRLRWRSLSMIVVFCRSSMVCGSPWKPGHMVLTFKLAIRRAGVLLFAWCWVLQPVCRFCLSSMHPNGSSRLWRNSTLLPWVKVGGDYPMEPENSSQRREQQPLAPLSTPNELRLSCAYAGTAKLEWPLQVQALGRWYMEILECPAARIPFSMLLARSNGKASWYSQWQRSCSSCRKVLRGWTNRLQGSTPDFLLGLTPLALDSPKSSKRQWSYLKHSWGSGSWAPARISTRRWACMAHV
jgi:hypothetical protein